MLKLGVTIPTHNYEEFEKYILSSINYLHKGLGEITKIYLCMAIQGPTWTKGKVRYVKDVCKPYSIKIRTAKAKLREYPRMTFLRRLCMDQLPNADYYLNIDHNHIFSNTKTRPLITSGVKYSHCLKYLEKFKDCGFVQCESFLGGALQGDTIQSTRNTRYWNCRGLIVRNIGPDKLLPDILKKNEGTLEERVMTFHLIERGFYPAKQFYNPTLHHGLTILETEEGKKSKIHCPIRTGKGNNAYIQNRYNDPTWQGLPQRSPLPKGLKSLYLKNGGNPALFKQLINPMEF